MSRLMGSEREWKATRGLLISEHTSVMCMCTANENLLPLGIFFFFIILTFSSPPRVLLMNPVD